jgi:RES domain-containing protein
MFYPAGLLEELEQLGATPLAAIVYRHVLGQNDPARMNSRGARWNPPQTASIYASFERETALAEGDYYLSLQSPPMKVRRAIFTIEVALQRVIDLRGGDILRRLGIGVEGLASTDLSLCQRIGGAVARLDCDGLIVPSVRRTGGANLVIYPARQELAEAEFKVVSHEIISGDR